MKITFVSRLRHFLKKRRRATIDECVAALSKYVTATQAMREYNRSHGRIVNKHKQLQQQSRRIAVGTRRYISHRLSWSRGIARVGPSTYALEVA